MKYKLTDAGNIVITDGKPTVIEDDGTEIAIDAISAQSRITALNAENKSYRTKAAERKTELEKFTGIDPIKATEAINTVAAMSDDHKLEVETLKTTLNTTWESKLADKDKEISTLKDDMYNKTVLSNFATSAIIKTTVLPPDIAAATFGKNFQHDGSAVDKAGNVIYSKANPGEPAQFEEAMTMILDQYPDKTAIMKGSTQSGSGSSGSINNNSSAPMTAVENIAAGLAERGI